MLATGIIVIGSIPSQMCLDMAHSEGLSLGKKKHPATQTVKSKRSVSNENTM